MTTTTNSSPVEQLYRATSRPRLVDVPALRFLGIDGHGDPNTSPAYAEAIQALYSVSYAAKFAIKKATGENLKVSPLEGLWWAEDPNAFRTGDRSGWEWTMMIRQPGPATEDLLERIADETAAKKQLPAVHDLRLLTFEEGPAAQVLHVGPYDEEAPTIDRLHAYIHDQGFVLDGKHHEIYLGDPRRAAPEKLRTIIRQPYAAT